MTPDNLSDDELKKLAPGLSKLKNENPFRVPDNYFDSLPDTIQQKINALPDLERMNKENPFSVPEGYFDSLPMNIQQRIVDEKKKKSIFGEWLSISFRPKYALAFVTVVLLALFGIMYLMKPKTVEAPDNYVSCEDVKNSSCFNDIDESTLVEILEHQDKNANVKEDNSIEQYLMDNDIDISQLENHL